MKQSDDHVYSSIGIQRTVRGQYDRFTELDVEISEHAAVSRLRPIQDGFDYWEEHVSSVRTELGGPAPGQARTMF
jgi:hypothetical protein